MATRLIEIASDLAALYPYAPVDEIVNTIAAAIESEPIIVEAIRNLNIPSQLELQRAEFKSQRLPTERKRITERIENARFFKRIKAIYMRPTYSSSALQSTRFDGAQLGLSSGIECAAGPSLDVPKRELEGTNENQPRVPMRDSAFIDYQDFVTPSESLARNSQDAAISIYDVLHRIDNKFDREQTLSLYDLYVILGLLESTHRNKPILTRISRILSRDLQLRNRTFRVDCRSELYRGDDLLPDTLRVPHPPSSSVSDSISEILRALILDEHKRLHDKAGQEFIRGDISYAVYIAKTRRFALDAGKLFSSV